MDIILPKDELVHIPKDVFKNIKQLQSIGKGSFGEVFKYVDPDTKKAFAIKQIPVPLENLLSTREQKEININRKLKHDHVVRFFNFHFIPKESISFAMEFMVNGSLKSRLNELEKQQGPVSGASLVKETEMLRMSIDILSGLQYLHNENVVHRDLRSSNVLMTADDRCKIADFGISAEINVLALKSGFSTRNVGNHFWHAPEMVDFSVEDSSSDSEDEGVGENTKVENKIKDGGEELHRLNNKVDIWSFGILVLEMIFNLPPYMKKPYGAYLNRLKQKGPSIPKFVSETVKQLLKLSLKLKADERATAAQLLRYVRGVYKTPDFDLFLSHNWGKDDANHKKVGILNQSLQKRGYKTWFDEEQMPPGTFTEKAMARGIAQSKVFVLFLTKEYMDKVNANGPKGVLDNCYLEFKHGIEKRTPENMLTVVMESEMLDERTWEEAFSMHMSKRIYLNMSGDFNDHEALKKYVDILCEAVDFIIHKQEEPSSLVSALLETGQPQPETRIMENKSKLTVVKKKQGRQQQVVAKTENQTQSNILLQRKENVKKHPQEIDQRDEAPLGCRNITFELLQCKGTLPHPRCHHIAVHDPKTTQLYVTCGRYGNTYYNDLHIYNTKTNVWTPRETTGEKPAHTASRGWLRDNNILVFGGYGGGRDFSNQVHACNVTTGAWEKIKTTGTPPSPRCSFTLWLQANYVAVFGGWGSKPTNLTSDEQFVGDGDGNHGRNNQLHKLDFTTTPPHWSKPPTTGPRPTPRDSAAYTQISTSGYVFGGYNKTQGDLDDLHCIDLVNFTWTSITTSGEVPTRRTGSTMAAINEHELFVCGGCGSNDGVQGDCYVLLLPSKTWKKLSSLNFAPTARHTLTPVGEGQYVLFGGWNESVIATNICGLFRIV